MQTATGSKTGIGSPAIVARGLTKRFGRVTAVDDLSFEVVPGSVTGFVGPNGAGKSTTLRMLLGLVEPDGEPPRCSACPTAASTDRHGRWVRCWRSRACTRSGRAGTTCASSPPRRGR